MNDEDFLKAEQIIKNFQVDLKSLRINFVEEVLRDEIKAGYYGESVKENFSVLLPAEQNLILRALRLQEVSQGRRLKFRLAVQGLFPNSRVCFFEGRWLLYLPQKKSELTLKKVALIENLFMDFSNAEMELYFEKPFGVFGMPQTMVLDSMVIC